MYAYKKNKDKTIKVELSEETAQLHVSSGNSKIGKISNFSTLPGDKDHCVVNKKLGEATTDVPGSCTGYSNLCWNSCYAHNSLSRYWGSCTVPWAENTLLLRSGRLWGLLDKWMAKNKPDEFRVNVSGEIENTDQLTHWCELAAKYPETKFCVYTKNYAALIEYAKAGKEYPQNMCVNISQWHHCADAAIRKLRELGVTLNVFEYDDSNVKGNQLSPEDIERLSKMRHCPAVLESGKMDHSVQCKTCGYCYDNDGKETAVYSH